MSETEQRKSVQPIFVVTGANRGIGLGFCKRLLIQLCSGHPSDSSPNARPASGKQWEYWEDCDGLTLIMACRDVDRGRAARAQLLQQLDLHISQIKTPAKSERAKKFRGNLAIEVAFIDLTIGASVLKFARWIGDRFSYVSHLILNAGVAQIVGIWPWSTITQFIANPSAAMRAPRYLMERVGDHSSDGLGLVWQTNVLGNYVLLKSLGELLAECQKVLGISSRVIWMSCLSTFLDPYHYDPQDPQLTASEHPHQDSKYQVELLAALFNRKKTSSTFHMVVTPGIVAGTGLDQFSNRGLWRALKTFTFATARLVNSHSFPASTYDATISATHASLLDIRSLQEQFGKEESQIKLYSRAPFKREPYVDYEASLPLDNLNDARSIQIESLCAHLYHTFLRRQRNA
ncbi:hypothetical protein DFH06DRAFT_993547 [Mycena polygramma]|nr:hypothetical protein DFH06DRAFT_999639 [Mycena polygramma]KAJ7654443.1 hypothetical protein DFH06DRAFT_993547 [Mycena polygramma]